MKAAQRSSGGLAIREAFELPSLSRSILTRLTPSGPLKPSRYEAAIGMLNEADEITDFDFRPVNLFRKAENERIPLGLYILYRVSERKNGSAPQNVATYEQLFKDAVLFGSGNEELNAALADFIRRDRRLVYSGINDDARGVQTWKEEPTRTIRLTWAGYRYLVDVAVSPSYAQWAFSQNRSFVARHWDGPLDHTNIQKRMAFALDCFCELLEEELVQMQKVLDDLSNDTRPKTRGRGKAKDKDKDKVEVAARAVRILKAHCFGINAPMGDVFFRASPHFLSSIANAVRGMDSEWRQKRGTTKRDVQEQVDSSLRGALELSRTLHEWLEAAEEFNLEYKKLFEACPLHWEEAVTWMRLDVNTFDDEMTEFLRSAKVRWEGEQ